MAKVITFSRTFPAYHHKKGQPTYFVEKFWNSLDKDKDENYFVNIGKMNRGVEENVFDHFIDSLKPIAESKHHTIRAGNRFKVGDKFSPRVWSGKPYQSKQIIIAPDIEVKKVWDFEIEKSDSILPMDYENHIIINHKFYQINYPIMKELAENDGLSLSELLHWFKYPNNFKGQIICWNENIEY